MTFEQLNLIEPILKALSDQQYTTPTPIQAESIPPLLEGSDLLGCAQTGTGKTAAFAIPILQHLAAHKQVGKPKIKALILTPTRELAIQIDESFASYGRYTSIKHTVIFGGVSQKQQTDILHKGVEVLVATPGRLLDLIAQKYISLKDLSHFVLDEADRMLDMGFIHDIKKILPLLPPKRQSLFFSATMPEEIQRLASSILHNPVFVEVTPVSSTVEMIDQSLYYVAKADKVPLLLHILKDKNIASMLVFARTKHGSDKLAKLLVRNGIAAEAIHGNKSQNARVKALSNFKDRTTRVLIATDIAARGIDIDGLTHVVNYELPNVPETYVHRIGRTGRAGAEGTAIAFCDVEEMPLMRDIEKLIKIKVPVVHDHPYISEEFVEQQSVKVIEIKQKEKEKKAWRGSRSNGEFYRRKNKQQADSASQKSNK